MAKKRVESPSTERNRVSVNFNDRDYETLTQRAKEERLPIATYTRRLILLQLAPTASGLRGGSKG